MHKMKTTSLLFFQRTQKRSNSRINMLRLLWEKAKDQTFNNVVFDIKFGFEKICNVFKWL